MHDEKKDHKNHIHTCNANDCSKHQYTRGSSAFETACIISGFSLSLSLSLSLLLSNYDENKFAAFSIEPDPTMSSMSSFFHDTWSIISCAYISLSLSLPLLFSHCKFIVVNVNFMSWEIQDWDLVGQTAFMGFVFLSAGAHVHPIS